MVALASTVSVAAIAFDHLAGQADVIPLDPDKPNAPDAKPPTIGAYPTGYNLLLVGNDTREGQRGIGGNDEGARNDVTILLHVSADHTSATAVSFPRDMIVPLPACSDGKGGGYPAVSAEMINQSLGRGGLSCTATTVESLTGLKVQFAGLITFRGVIEMSNAVGGVNVCVTGPIHDTDSGLNITKAGNVKLRGSQALAFLRARHGIGDNSDLGRISSQQVFLSSLVRTLKSRETLTDLPKLYNIASAATRNMTLSSSLVHPDTMVAIAQSLADIPLEKVLFLQYPSTTALGGIYENRVAPLPAQAENLFSILRADKPFVLGEKENSRGSITTTAKPTKKPTRAPTSSPTPGATSSPTKTAKPKPTKKPVKSQVIDGLSGQSAADQTCTKAN